MSNEEMGTPVEYKMPSPLHLDSVEDMLQKCRTFKQQLSIFLAAAGLEKDVANTFLALPGVVRVHNLRMWALSLDKTALAAHLAIRQGVPPQKVLEQATRLVQDKYNFFEMTLQIEEFSDQMEDCSQCKMPQS